MVQKYEAFLYNVVHTVELAALINNQPSKQLYVYLYTWPNIFQTRISFSLIFTIFTFSFLQRNYTDLKNWN